MGIAHRLPLRDYAQHLIFPWGFLNKNVQHIYIYIGIYIYKFSLRSDMSVACKKTLAEVRNRDPGVG